MQMNTFLDSYVDKSLGDVIKFPENVEVIIALDTASIEEKQVEFEPGKQKTRWIISIDGKNYWAGRKVIDGMKAAKDSGAKAVRIIRQGTGMKTGYVVLPIK